MHLMLLASHFQQSSLAVGRSFYGRSAQKAARKESYCLSFERGGKGRSHLANDNAGDGQRGDWGNVVGHTAALAILLVRDLARIDCFELWTEQPPSKLELVEVFNSAQLHETCQPKHVFALVPSRSQIIWPACLHCRPRVEVG